MRVYPKDSMDRFGDDLTELILSYLTFKDKIRLESVSKQWQRCISEKQFELELLLNRKKIFPSFVDVRKVIQYKYLFSHMFELVAKKFPYITKVSIIDEDNKSEVFSLIGRYCPNIKSFKYRTVNARYNPVNKLMYHEEFEFFRMYGHKLEELHLYGILWRFTGFLNFCPNVKIISVGNTDFLFNEDKEYLPNLERIDSFITIASLEIVKVFTLFSYKYSKTMSSLKLVLSHLTKDALKTCIECICRFENLTELTIIFERIEIDEPIDISLILIGEKCTKLSKLDLHITYGLRISYKFFYVFPKYKAIKYIKLYIPYTETLYGSVQCFKYCKQLIKLDIHYWGLREDFFANNHLFIPKLQFLNITTGQLFSDTFFNSFILLQDMEKIELIEGGDLEKVFCYYRKNQGRYTGKPEK